MMNHHGGGKEAWCFPSYTADMSSLLAKNTNSSQGSNVSPLFTQRGDVLIRDFRSRRRNYVVLAVSFEHKEQCLLYRRVAGYRLQKNVPCWHNLAVALPGRRSPRVATRLLGSRQQAGASSSGQVHEWRLEC
jgi:hypothetical protein